MVAAPSLQSCDLFFAGARGQIGSLSDDVGSGPHEWDLVRAISWRLFFPPLRRAAVSFFILELVAFLAAADILRRREAVSSTASGIDGLTAEP